MSEVMLTTLDNPYNPFDNFDEWYAYDENKGYHTCSLLARIAWVSNELSEEDNRLAIDEAMNIIMRNDPLDLYIKIKKNPKTN